MRRHEDMKPGAGKRTFWQQPKVWLAAAIGVYLVSLVFANNDDVPVQLIFAELTMPLYGLILLVAVLAFAVGWVVGRSGARDKVKKD